VCGLDCILISIKFEKDFVKLAALLAFLESSRCFPLNPRGGESKCYFYKVQEGPCKITECGAGPPINFYNA
jgi:hypothetical protein